MNWIINRSKKMPYHTHLNQLLGPIINDIDNLNWLFSDIEINGYGIPGAIPDETTLNHEDDYAVLNPTEFKHVLTADLQIIWGMVIGIRKGHQILENLSEIPYVEGHPGIFVKDVFQHPGSVIEIACFDSSYTVVKFRDARLSEKFKSYFDEAIDLETFRRKNF